MAKIELEPKLEITQDLLDRLSKRILATDSDDRIKVSIFSENGDDGFVFENFTKNTKLILTAHWQAGELVFLQRFGFVIRLDEKWLDLIITYAKEHRVGDFANTVTTNAHNWLFAPGFDTIPPSETDNT